MVRLPVLGLACLVGFGTFPAADDGPKLGVSAPSSNLLTGYYRTFLEDRDLERFRQNVQARYSEENLGALVVVKEEDTRRAAVLALGLVGSYGCNEALARGLKDQDVMVRGLTEAALWAVWFRGGTADQNERLQRVREEIGRGRLEEAYELATALIKAAPEYAEAYNQRAIASYGQERFEQSVEDCERVLELNPYHFGALSGMGQCYLRMGKRLQALAVFQKALELQPYSEGLRQTVRALTAVGA